MMWTVKLFILSVILKLSSEEETIQVNITQGTIMGLQNTTVYHGILFYSFRGIPYAKPNVGRNKFNVAVPSENWTGVLDATKHGNFCPRLENKIMVGNEDCLFLNVYTPDLNRDARRAVMVYIHGGGFYKNDGNDNLLGPDYLIEKNVILVTMNYRNGVIGFLNTGDASAPGNVGLKDQNLVLKWVEQNIIYFGGCSSRVTLFGQSLGASFVHYHMMSPMSKGLFKGAILQSGTAVNTWAFTHDPKKIATALGSVLGINITNETDFVDKLKDKSSEDLLDASRRLSFGHHGTFTASVEENFGQDIFLSDNPWKILTSGNISDVPIMIGITENEVGSMFINSFTSTRIIYELFQLNDPLTQFIPKHLNITDQEQIKKITDNFSKIYFNATSITLNVSAVLTIMNDLIFNHATLMSAEIMNARISSSVYQYLFNYYTTQGIVRRSIPEIVNLTSATHYDDLVFIFYSPYLNNLPTLGSVDAQKIDEIVEMWTNFAKEGNPSPTAQSAKVVWQPTNGNKTYLDIGPELELKNNLWKDRIALWANIFSNIIGDYVSLFN